MRKYCGASELVVILPRCDKNKDDFVKSKTEGESEAAKKMVQQSE